MKKKILIILAIILFIVILLLLIIHTFNNRVISPSEIIETTSIKNKYYPGC